MKYISILGSTGSIGTQTLDVIRQHPDQFKVVALSAGRNSDLLIQQALEFDPILVTVETKELADAIRHLIPPHIYISYGEQGLIEAATIEQADIVITAIVGSRGLPATLAAIDAGKKIGLANKETLVTAGHIVMERAKQKQVPIIPVDSEHSAIFQCLNGERREDLASITVTASGGSFRDQTRDQLKDVTVEQALNHPNWSMGAKITIDSATMANKGLEVIEAHWLFDVNYDEINVLVHPQSIIHSYVEFKDRSVIAQLGMPDMRVPIQYALTYPKRIHLNTEPLNLAKLSQLTFREMDFERYPMMRLAYECGRANLSAPIAYNAANEIAVERFLKREISFLQIEQIVENVLQSYNPIQVQTVEAILEVDLEARLLARTK